MPKKPAFLTKDGDEIEELPPVYVPTPSHADAGESQAGTLPRSGLPQLDGGGTPDALTPLQEVQAANRRAVEAGEGFVEDHPESEVVRYVSRIEVLSAYRFTGHLATAPAWVDKNWLAYEDGPTLNVSRENGDFVGTARMGDYVVQQLAVVDDLREPSGRRTLPQHIAVIPDAEFKRLFLPVRAARSEAEAALSKGDMQ